MRKANELLLGLTLALAGCAHAPPAPQNPVGFESAFAARRMTAPANGVWTSADLLEVALARSPVVAAAAARRSAALASLRATRLPRAPTLTLTAEYADERPTFGGGAKGEFPLRSWGLRRAQIGAAELTALQALYDHAEAVWTVRAALARALAAADGAETERATAERLEALRSERVARIERRVALGEDERPLALSSRVELARAAARRRDAEARHLAARLALAATLSLPAEAIEGLRISVSAAGPQGDLASLRRAAIAGRSDVLRAVADYDLAEVALRTEVARQYPEVRLGPGYMYDHGVNKLPFDLSLGLPPSDGNRSGIARAEAERAAAGRALEAAQAGVLARIDAAVAARAAAQDTTTKIERDALSAARGLAERSARAVRAGQADRVDELGARALVAETELDLAAAQSGARLAAVDLEDALRHAADPAEAVVLARVLAAAGALR